MKYRFGCKVIWKNLTFSTGIDALRKAIDGLRLVPGGFELGMDHKR